MRQLRLSIFVAVLLLLAGVASASLAQVPGGRVRRAQFDKYAAKFNKVYATTSEREVAFSNYVRNMRLAAVMQRRNPLATFGENHLSDQAPRPHVPVNRAHRQPSDEHVLKAMFGDKGAPAKIDWRDRGAVPPVQNEGWECGGEDTSRPMADIGTSIMFIRGFTSTLVGLSWAQINDCDSQCGCGGCWPEQAAKWLINNTTGWATAASYPERQQQCAMNSSVVIGAKVLGYVAGKPNSLEGTKSMVAGNPIDVGVNALAWQTYTGGIMTDCGSPGSVDHVAVVVGYDTLNHPPYWIVKNSWGTSWGEDGYIRLSMEGNVCGILDMPFSLEMSPNFTPTRWSS